ncbi:hypothetical protein [Cryptosporangium minutisporangium]|uniref:hypothetical protein n=1 Tax=Cryptosporangium minutisporangium TaxID=113569 RepID=UPI0031F041E9
MISPFGGYAAGLPGVPWVQLVLHSLPDPLAVPAAFAGVCAAGVRLGVHCARWRRRSIRRDDRRPARRPLGAAVPTVLGDPGFAARARACAPPVGSPPPGDVAVEVLASVCGVHDWTRG